MSQEMSRVEVGSGFPQPGFLDVADFCQHRWSRARERLGH